MHRTIRRFGFVNDEDLINEIAEEMCKRFRWEAIEYVLQYIAVGKTKNQFYEKDTKLVQITWDDIGNCLYRRFSSFPEKIFVHQQNDISPRYFLHENWPDFGKAYADYFYTLNPDPRIDTLTPKKMQKGKKAILRYIETGQLIQK
jgi:hypothetical protein